MVDIFLTIKFFVTPHVIYLEQNMFVVKYITVYERDYNFFRFMATLYFIIIL